MFFLGSFQLISIKFTTFLNIFLTKTKNKRRLQNSRYKSYYPYSIKYFKLNKKAGLNIISFNIQQANI